MVRISGAVTSIVRTCHGTILLALIEAAAANVVKPRGGLFSCHYYEFSYNFCAGLACRNPFQSTTAVTIYNNVIAKKSLLASFIFEWPIMSFSDNQAP
jgi:hypothetical protein